MNLSRSAATLGQVRLRARELGIGRLSTMTRADLVDAIRAAEQRRIEAEARDRHAEHMDAASQIEAR